MLAIVVGLILLLLFCSCGAKRRTINESRERGESVYLATQYEAGLYRRLDSTARSKTYTTITEVEFASVGDSLVSIDRLYIQGDTIDLRGLSGLTIKAIRQISTGDERETKHQSHESEEQRQTQTAILRSKEKTQTYEQVSPAPDPYRWRYIFFISIIVLAVLLYLGRIPFVDWIRRLLRGLVKH